MSTPQQPPYSCLGAWARMDSAGYHFAWLSAKPRLEPPRWRVYCFR